MSGSTAMAERVDAETVQALMCRYFHEMRAALEEHGGTVEKFIGERGGRRVRRAGGARGRRP